MLCNACGQKAGVVLTRQYRDEGNGFYWTQRKNKCSCGNTFTTIELPSEEYSRLLTAASAEPDR